jgi:hypothetical protein
VPVAVDAIGMAFGMSRTARRTSVNGASTGSIIGE